MGTRWRRSLEVVELTASTLEMALGYEHAKIRELAEPAHHPDAAHPEHRHQTDWFYAIAAQHLAAAEDVLLPHVQRLPDGAQMVTRYVGNAKELERSLRFLKGRQYGDSRFVDLRHTELWHYIDRLLGEHEQMEAMCSRRICEQLESLDVNTLTEDLLEAEEVAPTRAHPVSPLTGRPRTGWFRFIRAQPGLLRKPGSGATNRKPITRYCSSASRCWRRRGRTTASPIRHRMTRRFSTAG
jgi:hypothetical protein